MSSPHPTRSVSPTPLVDALIQRLAALPPATRQDRVWTRLLLLTVAHLLTLGRHTLTQLLLLLTGGTTDWSAWYRLFNRSRVDWAALEQATIRAWAATYPPGAPYLLVTDMTQLPRSSRRLPGVGYAKAPRTPPFRPGIHLAQRLELASGLLPCSAQGDSRAVPLAATILRAAKTPPIADLPVQTEAQAAVALVRQVRTVLDTAVPGAAERGLLVLADGAYGNTPFFAGLPARTYGLARCAKNRVLYDLPVHVPGTRGRRRLYGPRQGPPAARVHAGRDDRTVTVRVRGKVITLRVRVEGPCLIRGAADRPLMLILVTGRTLRQGERKRWYGPHVFLVTAVARHGQWDLPLPLADLLTAAWQRWEVEVMHRELKSGFGLGEQQQWSAAGAWEVVRWLLWTYAQVILVVYAVWEYAPPPDPVPRRWHRPRRWAVGRVLAEVRSELWQLAPFRPTFAQSADSWGEMTAWLATLTAAVAGQRRI